MNSDKLEKIVNAVLYEGYVLYPYRASAVKNKQRWNFGCLYPQSYAELQTGSDASSMQTQCLIVGDPSSTLEIRVKFLHLISREVKGLVTQTDDRTGRLQSDFHPVESLQVGDKKIYSWQEAIERTIEAPALKIDDLIGAPYLIGFHFSESYAVESLSDPEGLERGHIVRKQQEVEGTVEISATEVAEHLYQITVTILNRTDLTANSQRDQALMSSLLSAHTILAVQSGEFVSLLEPPEQYKTHAQECKNIGTWPVLIGDAPEKDLMLSSPIILYDYPEVAPESAGDLFDSTEIDEILTLRIMALSDDEKTQMRLIDERARRILERTEKLPAAELMKLHGTLRGMQKTKEEE